jgi:hypothetical protein
MENAVQALLIAAGVLIGIMVISLGVTLFGSLGDYVGNTQEQIDANAVQKFNEQFTRYIDGILTIQDVVTAANTAFDSNTNYGLTEPTDNNYYVKVIMPGDDELEKNIDEKMTELLKDCIDKKYQCTVTFNSNTGRVCRVDFTEET